ncbi:MAG: endonuclease/exonuclease/phosphatase family protein [Rhodobacteraceae bacterium]|nr:endonuclease/exonuclease/phosphatase family protein [Paracoccaceae bacterium]
MKAKTVLYLALAVVFVLLAGCAISNRYYVPPAFEDAEVENASAKSGTGSDYLSLVTWNIGYGGMGKESDFIMDLGTQKRPLSAGLVDKNLAAITQKLTQMDADIFLFQEAAEPSWNTYRRDVLKTVAGALPEYAFVFGADVDTRYVPPPYNVKVGNAIFSRVKVAASERRGLPLEPTFELGVFRKGYRMHIIRISGDTNWVIVNIHLSTFDNLENNVREKQVAALMAFVEKEYAIGNHVVVGGDWNLRLAQNEFPHQTEERFQFWIRDFPVNMKPKGWKWAVDGSEPTVRTAHKPYVKGENYVLTVDGFLVSPNVRVISARTENLGFEYTDHHPVSVQLQAQ